MPDSSDATAGRPVFENRHQGLPHALSAFEAALGAAAAPGHDNFRPPLEDAERMSLLDRFATEEHPIVPTELVDLYGWHDGLNAPPGSPESELLGGWRFLPLRDLVAFYEQDWLPNVTEMYEYVGSDIPELGRHRHYLPVLPDLSGTRAVSLWPSRPARGYSEDDNFSHLMIMGHGFDYEPTTHGPMSFVALIELWTALLASGGLRWREDESLQEPGYAPLHWTTYRSVHL